MCTHIQLDGPWWPSHVTYQMYLLYAQRAILLPSMARIVPIYYGKPLYLSDMYHDISKTGYIIDTYRVWHILGNLFSFWDTNNFFLDSVLYWYTTSTRVWKPHGCIILRLVYARLPKKIRIKSQSETVGIPQRIVSNLQTTNTRQYYGYRVPTAGCAFVLWSYGTNECNFPAGNTVGFFYVLWESRLP